MTTVEQPAATGPVDTRTVRKATARQFRPRRSVPAAAVAVVLLAGATLTAVEIIARLLDGSAGVLPVDWLARQGGRTHWSDLATAAVAGVAILLGLLLLWLAIWPGRRRVVPLVPDRPGVVMAIRRPALRRIAADAAGTVDGVDAVVVRGGRRRLTARVDTPLRDPGDLGAQVQQAVTDRIARLAPAPMPPVRVDVVAKGTD